MAKTTIGTDHDISICRYAQGVSMDFVERKVLDGWKERTVPASGGMTEMIIFCFVDLQGGFG